MKTFILIFGLLISINAYADYDGWRGGGDSGHFRGDHHGWNRGYGDSGHYRPHGGYRYSHHQPAPRWQNNCQFNPYNGMTYCAPAAGNYVAPPQFNITIPLGPRW